MKNDPKRHQNDEPNEFRTEIPPELSDSEENDSDENVQDGSNPGYELLPQNEIEDTNDDIEDSPQTLDEILRQIEPSHQVQDLIQESQRNQIAEEVQEREAIYSQTQSDSSTIDMSRGRVELIRSAMAGFQLPSSAIPSWASNLSESEWEKLVNDKLKTSSQKEKSLFNKSNESSPNLHPTTKDDSKATFSSTISCLSKRPI